MKRITVLLMSVVMIFAIGVNSFASEKEFDLIEYLENNTIETYSEFVDVLENATGYPVENLALSSLNNDCNQETDFSYVIDYENNLVEVTTVYESATTKSSSSKTATASHDTYSSSGKKLYTLNVTGTFSYSATGCNIVFKSGNFVPASSSSWRSTPSVTSGRINADKVYARISGTAKYLLQTSTYQLSLMCDNTGHITTSFTRP